MTTPSLTIGMPVYNGERFLRPALDSLLAQACGDFELLISDNASTDSTPAICAEYTARDPRIRYVRQPENRGVFANVTFLAESARTEFFMLVGDDDVYEPNYVAVMMELFRRHPETDLAYSNYGFIDPQGALSPSGLAVFLDGRVSRARNFQRFLLARIVLPMMMGVFRTSSFRRALPFVRFPDGMTGSVDTVFLMRFLTYANVESSDLVLFYYRIKERTSYLPASFRRSRWSYQWSVIRLNWTILTQHTLPIVARAPFGALRKVLLMLYAPIIYVADYSLIPAVQSLRKRFRRPQ